MARIVGDLVPEDDYTHPLGSEPSFNESMYFNFFDPSLELGGFLRLGNRANEGYAEMTVTLFRPDSTVLFMFQRAPITDNKSFAAGGCRFEVLEPGERLRSVYEGVTLQLRDPRTLANPGAAFATAPRVPVRLDLVHEAVGPMYGRAHSPEEDALPAEQQFARAHYEQHMHVGGELSLGSENLRIDGFGLRDHSWGPRRWQAVDGYEWLTLNFGAEFGAMVSVVRRSSNEQVRGVVVRGMDLVPIVRAEIDIEYEANQLYHRSVHTKVKTAAGEELEFDGRVRGFIPLRNRREGRVTHIGEGMTEWRCGSRTGFGLSELLRQTS